MSGAGDHDLSGAWVGIYNYPHSWPPTRFQATLHDADGRLTGETQEQDHGFTAGATLRALVEGRREGSAVTFVKIYEDQDFNPEFVRYEGNVQPGGDEISGRWEVPGVWAGTFIMTRESGAEEAIEDEVGETLGL